MSWDQLKAMIQEGFDIDQKDRTTAPTSCPSCYTALGAGPNGTLHCPWDGLVWPDDASAWGEFPGSY